jgi:uncharacterized membrane protein
VAFVKYSAERVTDIRTAWLGLFVALPGMLVSAMLLNPYAYPM